MTLLAAIVLLLVIAGLALLAERFIGRIAAAIVAGLGILVFLVLLLDDTGTRIG